MGLVRSLLTGMSQMRADADSGEGGAPAPWDDYWYQPVGYGTSTGIRISPETVKRIATVYACVSIISKMIAAFPYGMFRELSNGGKDPAPKHPVHRLIASQPNEKQTAFEWRFMMQGHLELRGNAFSEIVLDSRGWPVQLLPMHPDRVLVEVMPNGRLRYKYNDPLLHGQTRALLQEEVFHLRNWSDDGYVGQSTIALGADVFGVALAAQEYSARFFNNDARPGGIITGAKFKDKTAEDEFKANWQRSQTGANRHKVAVLPTGLDFKEIGINPNDAQLLEARKFSRIEICSLFGVPPHLIGETEKTATYASVEQFNLMFVTECLWPRVVNWEQTTQRDLIQDEQFLAKFSMAALLRGDTAARYGAYKIGIENGWLSQNDVRIMEGLNPIADGGDYWRPLNWARLKDASVPQKANPALPAGPSGPGGNPDDNGATNDSSATMLRGRLMLMASAGADRCMRKEVAAVRKLLEREAALGEYESFYTEHAGFIAEVLRVKPEHARDYCQGHILQLVTRGSDDSAAYRLVNEDWPRTGARELANLAVGDVQ